MVRVLAGLAGLVAGYAIERGFPQTGESDDGLLVWSAIVASLGVAALAYAVAALLADGGKG